jgi:hypothetical protein
MEFKEKDLVACVIKNGDNLVYGDVYEITSISMDGRYYRINGESSGYDSFYFRHATPKEIFDYKYVGDKIAVHCPTEELANEFLGLANGFGYGNGKKEIGMNTNDYPYRSGDTYTLEEYSVNYSLKDWYERHNYKIVEFKSEKKCDWFKDFDIRDYYRNLGGAETIHIPEMFGSDIKYNEIELPNLDFGIIKKTNYAEKFLPSHISGYSGSLEFSFKTKPQIEFVKHDKLKRTTVVAFKDGKTITSKVRKGEKYNEYIGIMTCLVKYLTGFNPRDLREYMDYAQDLDVVEIKKRSQATKDESKQRNKDIDRVKQEAKKLGLELK